MTFNIGPVEFLNPEVLWWAIPLVLFVIILLKINFVKNYDLGSKKIKSGRRWMTVSRIVIGILLIIALMNPVILAKTEADSAPRLEVLVDRSESMDVFDMSFVPGLTEALGNEIPTEIKVISEGSDSDVGNKIISSLEEGKNLLLVSDGWVTKGASIGDVFQAASDLDATINLIAIEPEEADMAVSLFGPDKTIAGAENTFLIDVSGVLNEQYSVSVVVDGLTIHDSKRSDSSFTLTHAFETEGYHTIKAIVRPLTGKDFFPENNIFSKTVKVVEKPKVLFVTERVDPLIIVLERLYDVDEVASLPSSLDKYHAVVINDMHGDAFIFSAVEKLKEYVADGNGLFVVGGHNSFDLGDYRNSLIESILPVKVGTGERKIGQATLVFAVDISGSTSQRASGSPYTVVEVEKALAVSMIGDLSPNHIVGAIAFDNDAHLVHEPEPLYTGKEVLVDKVSRLKSGLGTSIANGLKGAAQLMEGRSGSRNIVLFTDGAAQNDKEGAVVEIAEIIASQGMTVYTVGVNVDESNRILMQEVAEAGGGVYLEASNKNVLKTLFGQPSEVPPGDLFGLIVIDGNHFITSGDSPQANFDAYNQVLPKDSARMLVATDFGNPALTTWNFGIGRVATFTAFAARGNLGELLNRGESRLLSRTMNWAIGDPERKLPFVVTTEDFRIGETGKVLVKSSSFPSAEGFEFVQIAEDLYSANVMQDKIGVGSVLGASYAVNYELEKQNIGRNPELIEKVKASGGQIFAADDVDGIVENVKTRSRKTIVREQGLQWPLLLAALVIFLLDIMIRRLVRWSD